MNNKGQILPIFVILFPILIIIISYIVDIGIMYTEKRRIVNITNEAITYYFEKNDSLKTKEIIDRNIKDAIVNIEYYEDRITISITKKHKSIYNIINLNDEINVKYTGYFIDKRIVKG